MTPTRVVRFTRAGFGYKRGATVRLPYDLAWNYIELGYADLAEFLMVAEE